MTEKCSDVGCGAAATWMRCTQFAGEHYYCEIHAKAEKDFGKGDDSCYWTTTYDHNVRMAEKAEKKVEKRMLRQSSLGEEQCGEIAWPGSIGDPAQQTVVIRKDLNMRKGKIAAQAGHAFMKDLLDKWKNKTEIGTLHTAEIEYYFTKFTKIVLSVDSEAELDAVYAKAKEAGLTCHMIIDSGKTEFNGVPTKTCICIGPHFKSEIDPITSHLKLF